MNFARSFLGTLMRTNYPARLHIEWLRDCSVIVLRRSDFRKPFSIKLLLGEPQTHDKDLKININTQAIPLISVYLQNNQLRIIKNNDDIPCDTFMIPYPLEL